MRLGPLRFWRHLRYHREIIKHLRWTTMDERRKDFYTELIGTGSLIFDIGANMGNRSKIFRALGCNVIAYEPQSYCAEFLRVAFAGDPKFQLEKLALSSQPGETILYLSEAHTLSTVDTEWMDKIRKGERFSTQEWRRTEVVKLSTLKEQIEKHGAPDFIKIDVEGHEYQVLLGLEHPVSCLSIEFASESETSIRKCIDHLDSLDHYLYKISLGESMQYHTRYWLDGAKIKEELACLRKSDPLVWGDIYACRQSSAQE